MTDQMKERILAALRAAIEVVESGQDSDMAFLTTYAEGMDRHDLPEDAEGEAEQELENRRDAASDDTGWHPGSCNIGWGVYVPVQVVDVRDNGPDPKRPQFDMILDIQLRDWNGEDGKYTPFMELS